MICLSYLSRFAAVMSVISCVHTAPAQASSPIVVLRCCDAAGSCTWEDPSATCPSGSVQYRVILEDACARGSASPHCTLCPPGMACLPPDTTPIDYLCCEQVSGESHCEQVPTIDACDGDFDLLLCEFGQTLEDGTEVCYPP